MTKTIIVGGDISPKPDKKITFNSFINDDGVVSKPPVLKPFEFEYIELICKDYRNSGQDLLFAYENPYERGTSGYLYLGHWNDGVV